MQAERAMGPPPSPDLCPGPPLRGRLVLRSFPLRLWFISAFLVFLAAFMFFQVRPALRDARCAPGALLVSDGAVRAATGRRSCGAR